MDLNINYYLVLGLSNYASEKDIKKCYYSLSKKFHPDLVKDSASESLFAEISIAYSILGDEELKKDYDIRSRFGKNYNEMQELFLINTEIDYSKEKSRYDDFKKNEILNIVLKISYQEFTGSLTYDRWVTCKECHGTGKDLKSKIVIRDDEGNIKGIFDSDNGCDFCDGTGKDRVGGECSFCRGKGKIGIDHCPACKGDKRILGKQKLSNIKLDLDKKETIIQSMGNFSKDETGKVGNLILVNENL